MVFHIWTLPSVAQCETGREPILEYPLLLYRSVNKEEFETTALGGMLD
jgi:hypothetical protein